MQFTLVAAAVSVEGPASQEELTEVAELLRRTWEHTVDVIAAVYPGLDLIRQGEVVEPDEVRRRVIAMNEAATARRRAPAGPALSVVESRE
jgi:cellulase/cellobiase CelA1